MTLTLLYQYLVVPYCGLIDPIFLIHSIIVNVWNPACKQLLLTF